MTQDQFDRRLDKLLQAAAEDGLCGGCVVLRLIAAASVIIKESDHAVLLQHGIGRLNLTDSPSPDTTHH